MRPVSLCIAILLTTALGAHGTTYSVTMNTQPFSGSVFSLAFELTDGSGTGDGNSAAVLSNFQFSCSSCYTGPVPGSVFAFGSYTGGDLSSSVGLTDSDPILFMAYFQQQFLVGDSLTFELQLITTVPEAGTIPDGFAFYILDGWGTPLPTLAPDGYSFVSASLDPDFPTVSAYGWFADPSVIANVSTGVPEPAGLFVLGLGTLLALRKRCRRSAS